MKYYLLSGASNYVFVCFIIQNSCFWLFYYTKFTFKAQDNCYLPKILSEYWPHILHFLQPVFVINILWETATRFFQAFYSKYINLKQLQYSHENISAKFGRDRCLLHNITHSCVICINIYVCILHMYKCWLVFLCVYIDQKNVFF